MVNTRYDEECAVEVQDDEVSDSQVFRFDTPGQARVFAAEHAGAYHRGFIAVPASAEAAEEVAA